MIATKKLQGYANIGSNALGGREPFQAGLESKIGVGSNRTWIQDFIEICSLKKNSQKKNIVLQEKILVQEENHILVHDKNESILGFAEKRERESLVMDESSLKTLI